MVAQSKTVVSINGEKVIYTPPQGEWSITGNSGTSTGTNFIGTIDDQDVVFKRNNVKAGYIGGISTLQTSFGVGALQSNSGAGAGTGNTAFGTNALNATTTGATNTAVGSSALLKNVGGQANTAVGYGVLTNNTSGSYNTAVGQLALENVTTGSKNTAVGAKTGKGITTGNANTIIGANVGQSPNTALAANLSNNIIIADGRGNRRINVNAAGNVGIGTENPGARLEIVDNVGGALKIDDGSLGLSAAGKVLTSDPNGVGTWQVPIAPVLQVVDGITPGRVVNFAAGGANNYLESYIDLTPGKWIINIGLLIGPRAGATNVTANASYGARFTLSGSATAINENSFSFVGNNNLVFNMVTIGPTTMKYAMFADGVMRVNVTGSGTRRLYLWNVLSGEYGSAVGSVHVHGSNYFYATRTN